MEMRRRVAEGFQGQGNASVVMLTPWQMAADPVGCKVKPSMQMLDDNGLPTTVRLLYDPTNPALTVLPLEFSSWFVPALVGLFGLIVFAVGTTLAWFAKKPIVVMSG